MQALSQVFRLKGCEYSHARKKKKEAKRRRGHPETWGKKERARKGDRKTNDKHSVEKAGVE